MKKHRHVTFDAHVHVMNHKRLSRGWHWMRDYYDGEQRPTSSAPTPETLVKEINMAELKGFFNFFFPIFPSTSWKVNEWNDGFCSGQANALPLLSLHPTDTPQERHQLIREFLINRHFAGGKVHSYIQGIQLDSTWLPDIFESLPLSEETLRQIGGKTALRLVSSLGLARG